ncbi:hypothetical protein JCM3775_004321 [Rhodotorula graminis]
MALWPTLQPQQPHYDTQYSLPPPPNLVSARSHGPPPPPPPTSLDAARLRLTLERVKLELDGAREAVDEVLALREAVDSLGDEVRLGKEDRRAQGAVLEQQVLSALPAALDTVLAPLREAVTALGDSLATNQRRAEERLSALEARFEREGAAASERTGRVEREVRDGSAGATAALGAQLGALESKVTELERAGEAQREAFERLSSEVARVWARLEVRDEQMSTPSHPRPHHPQAPPAELTRLDSPAAPTVEPPSPSPAPLAPLPAAAAATAPAATTAASSSSTAPSPPTHHPRRFLPALRDIAPPAPASAPEPEPQQHAPALAPAAAPTGRTSPPTQTARAATVPRLLGGVARLASKRRVIEQDESLSEGEGAGEVGGAAGGGGGGGGGKRRRRVIEQDATPGGTQESGDTL